jgi:hypothetical protein
VERVFLSEQITSGAWTDRPLVGSLATEGRAMLVALAEDLLAEPDTTVVTSWDSRLGPFPLPGVEAVSIDNGVHAADCLNRLAGECDRTLVVAPELDGALVDRFDQVRTAGGRWSGCDRDALVLCSDKLATARHLQRAGIAVIETVEAGQVLSISGPVVWKPRDGAGSVGITIQPADQPPPDPAAIAQPLLEGLALSVAVLVSPQMAPREDDPVRQRRILALPLAEQRVNKESRFTYEGGLLPARLDVEQTTRAVRTLAIDACRAIDGLAGWIGVDILLPETGIPVVMEINPRLTTSYLGYRRLTQQPLAGWITHPETIPSDPETIEWSDRHVLFEASGDWRYD